MTERLLRDWLDEDVDQEKLAEGAAAIEEAAEKARLAAQTAAERKKGPPSMPDGASGDRSEGERSTAQTESSPRKQRRSW